MKGLPNTQAALESRTRSRNGWIVAGLGISLILAATALWRWTALADWLTPARIAEWIRSFGGHAWAPYLIVLAYPLANAILFPRTLLTLATVLTFGAWQGFVYSMTGILLAAISAYFIGRLLKPKTLTRLAGPRIDRVARALRREGLIAITAVRLVPLAPSVIEDLVAGAIRVSLWQFSLGTALGMLPGVLAITLFGREIAHGLETGERINYWVLAVVGVVLLTVTLAVRRWFVHLDPPQGHH